MRVGYVLRYWPTLSETFVAREIGAIGRSGVDVRVLAIGRRADGALQDELPSVPTARPPRAPWRGWRDVRAAPARWLARHLGAKAALRACWMAEVARAERLVRLHAHFAGEAAAWARAAAALADVPYSVTVHAVDLFKPAPWLVEVLRDADPVITVCRHHADHLRARYGVDATVVRCGVDPARYPSATPARQSARLVCVARDVPKKGLDELVAAARGVAPLRLVSDAVRLGGPGVLAGPLPPSRVPRILARASAFVLPCRVAEDGDRDGIPVALIEAMAAGLPVVTTRVSGIPELVDESVGWLVDPGQLRAVLAEVVARPAERARRGEAGRERVRAGWTLERQARELTRAWGVAP